MKDLHFVAVAGVVVRVVSVELFDTPLMILTRTLRFKAWLVAILLDCHIDCI